MAINSYLEELILPNTTPDVIESYSLLVEHAKTVSLGIGFEQFVLLDVQSCKDTLCSELERVDALKIEGNEQIDSFSSSISESVSPARLVDELAAFVNNTPVITFDSFKAQSLIELQEYGQVISETWLDLSDLARIGLPRLNNHSYSALGAAFCKDSIDSNTKKIQIIYQLWQIVLAALKDLPPSLIERFATWHENSNWEYRSLFSLLSAENPETAPYSLQEQRKHRIKTYERGEKHVDPEELYGGLDTVPVEEIEKAFSESGFVHAMYDNFEARDEQVLMAKEVHKAFSTSTHRAIEAGTGVGKSIAYLVPAAMLAKQNNITVGIATKTNALADQLIFHEIPALQKVFGERLTFTALKGYSHYPCLRKLERLASGQKELDSETLTDLAKLYTFVEQSVEGDLDSVSIKFDETGKKEITTTSVGCHKRLCPYYSSLCFLHGSRERAQYADLVVTNHALLFRDIKIDGAILPPIRHWILDEAHSVEDEARRQWAYSINEKDLHAAFDSLGSTKSGVLSNVIKHAAGMEGGTLHFALANKINAAIPPASISTTDFFDKVKLLASIGERSTYNNLDIWIDDAVRDTSVWQEVYESGTSLMQRLEVLAGHLKDILTLLDEESAELRNPLALAYEHITQSYDALKLVIDGSESDYVYSAHVNRKESIRSESLSAERINVGDLFAERWYPEMYSVIFTSAVIAVGEHFTHFLDAVGLSQIDSAEYDTLKLDSSYNYQQNMAVIIPDDMPAPNDRHYIDELEKLLYQIHIAMGGSTLTLFTNRREMEAVYNNLHLSLENKGIKVLMQTRGSSPKRLRDEFLADKTTSLFALRSFWEGFDAAGDALRCVVIPKLPFNRPTDPLARERELREHNAWFKYSLPEAVLTVKQACGRLIRTSTDTGCFVLADARVTQKGYGKLFISALPKQECTLVSKDEIASFIQNWLKHN